MHKKVEYNLTKLTDVFEWDVVNWSEALQFWLDNTKLDLAQTKALEIGARGGGLSIFLAEHCKEVICSDLKNPKDNAQALHKKYDLSNIEYKEINAFDIKEKNCDLIVSKSVLGSFAGDDQDKVISNIYNALKVGGEYWVVENLSATMLHKAARKAFVKWGGRWNYMEYSQLQKKFSKFKSFEFKTVGLFGAFGMTNSQRNFLGYFDKFIFNKISPQSMRYIVVAALRK